MTPTSTPWPRLQIDGVEVFVETVADQLDAAPDGQGLGAGRLETASDAVVGAFEHAQAAIVAIAQRTAQTAAAMQHTATHPTGLEIEFGLAMTASGGVLLVGAEAAASLKVRLWFQEFQPPVHP